MIFFFFWRHIDTKFQERGYFSSRMGRLVSCQPKCACCLLALTGACSFRLLAASPVGLWATNSIHCSWNTRKTSTLLRERELSMSAAHFCKCSYSLETFYNKIISQTNHLLFIFLDSSKSGKIFKIWKYATPYMLCWSGIKLLFSC